MSLLPINRMWERVDIVREDSDSALFMTLLNLGELVTKITVAGLVAAVVDDERHQYRQLYRLLRADGLGDWDQVLDDVLTGPSSQFLLQEAYEEKRQLLQKTSSDSWQHHAVSDLHKCLEIFDIKYDLPNKIDARKWFSMLVRLRNKTKGHGAPQNHLFGMACPSLEASLRTMTNEFSLFKREWAYLYRNSSGKYRVTQLGNNTSNFSELKSNKTYSLQDGVYIYIGERVLVDLIKSDPEANDFFIANGGFNGKRNIEYLSYTTGKILNGDLSSYLTPPFDLPLSETQGKGELDVQGKSWGNLPTAQSGYINRQALEKQLHQVLSDDRHPVITLVGRGGIGKTSLALSVLHQIAGTGLYDVIIWFSARDIDLLMPRPKDVKAHVLTPEDIAKEFARLMQPAESKEKGFSTSVYFTKALTTSPMEKPILYVFDNFETVRNPVDLYNWIDTYIRVPNKVLITTRSREFKGDYPVEVSGMTEAECDELVNLTASSLGIQSLLTSSYKKDLYRESDGHPYVIKILLGEVAKEGRITKVERIVASKDEVLEALFERTYALLSPVARRVFLTLCSWRSVVPQIAVEAVLLRPGNQRMDVDAGINELVQSSFIEINSSNKDNIPFLSVPLVASIFGQRKIAVDQLKSIVETDTKLLRALGAAQQSDIRHGIAPRIQNMFRHISETVAKGEETIEEYIPVLTFIARKEPIGWLYLASIYEQKGLQQNLEEAKNSIKHFLENSSGEEEKLREAWKRLSILCRQTEDYSGEVHALLQLSLLPGIAFYVCSDAVNRLNTLFNQEYVLDTEEKQIVGEHLARVMAERIEDGDATDYSRLAWLYLHLRDEQNALYFTELGFGKDPDNTYCRRLAERFDLL